MLKILRNISRKQRGFTAIELVVGVAIIGLIGAAATTGIVQVFKGSTLSSDRMTAINNVRTAGDWISRDARMAEGLIKLDEPGILLRIEWTDYAPPNGDPFDRFQVDYTLIDGKLNRSYQRSTGNPPVVAEQQSIFIAQNIAVDEDTLEFSGNQLTLTMTSTVGSASETRTFVISLRNLPQ